MCHMIIMTCNSVALLTGNVHLTESAHKLPRELIIPSDRLHLLDSIGQGEPGVYILHSHDTTLTTGPQCTFLPT